MAKTVSGPLTTHLAQEVTTLARCWKIVRMDGTVFRFTAHDVDIVIGGDGTYSASAGFQNTAIDSKSDLSVDNLEVFGIFDDATITLGDLRAGLFDYADVYIFFVNWQDTTQGPLKLRRGKLGEVVSSPQGWFTVEIRGMTQLLQQQVVELYGPECRADLFDSRCGLLKASYESVAHVSAVADATHITIVIDTPSGIYTSNDGWFQHGLLHFTDGDNSGRTLEIKSWNHTTNAVELYVPAGYPVVVNDTCTLLPGCDKALATCRDKFANLNNMRAESYLPGNDGAFLYPDIGGGA